MPMGKSKCRAARLLARQAASACESKSLRAPTNFTLPFSPNEVIASTPPGSMQRPLGSSGTPASRRIILGST
eukprot:scaffold19672_cov71-Phaeocystis_antarctica.AAC.3